MTTYAAPPNAEEALVLIERLVRFARQRGMTEPLDEPYARNALLHLFGFDVPYEGELPEERLDSPLPLLEPLLDYGYSIGLIPDNTTTYRDLLDARIMGLLMPRPSETAAAFRRRAETEGLMAATDAFYRLNIDANYIRMDRIRKNEYWLHETPYGKLEITINLSKPEKDPKEIAMLKSLPPSRYPKCLLCADNVGYAGRADHPARQNLRVLPVTLGGEQWFFQYSPYVYYNEHSIVFHSEHVPMQISSATFERLLDFVEQFPHYFIGSNADLPIVGGSILNHDHFQAGRHTFPMEEAPVEALFAHPDLPDVRYGIVKWPMSVVRVAGTNREQALEAASRLLDAWRGYSDAEADILAYTERNGARTPHNTITPIVRLRDNGEYEIDLVLRNNRTSEEHPDGIFHPHRELHHVKKENIGLIEVMGLAVLPGRLKSQLEQIAAYLSGSAVWNESEVRDAAHPLHAHADWIAALVAEWGTALSPEEALRATRSATGDKFLRVLEDAGVYKRTEEGQRAFRRFLAHAGLREVLY
ncbi:galactose-1-phosphate uridylyltransferase [Paenibacillus sp. 32O-W]|uniref:UDP-glucose--hexose-1-phosphate uridylyltransferase n=1 Tax=Paenibacillus sp. 32O-W TaxID=1695218 RepID=UPI00071F5D0C|nr:UDP-glucose--hexose-1-phosphate uridylyltransferase [Paenibacillus sp. 32O-W]ALS26528.1 galactose-1-phosphate uridylyltransferase [Paenibacillus sp. 32O-W]